MKRRSMAVPLAVLGLLALAGCSHAGVAPDMPPASAGIPTPTPIVWLTPAPTPEPEPEPTPAPPEQPGQPTAQPPAEPSHSLAPQPEPEPPEPEPTPDALPDGPDDAAVLAAYDRAEEAFGWFYLATLPEDPEDLQEVDGRIYYRVDSPQASSVADLRGRLRELFSDEIVDTLLPAGGEQYIDLDGVLYVQPGGRGSNLLLGEETRQVLRESESRCLVQITVEQVDPEQDFAVTGEEIHTFPYEKVGDKWIFTSFSLFR